MNENLKRSLILYAKDKEIDFRKFLNKLSKPIIKDLLIEILTMYFNDKNSSKLRELVALYIAGYEPTQKKLGYDEYKQAVDSDRLEFCEVKPQNTDKEKKKLNGSGSFNDYTPERFKKDLSNKPKVLACGYVKGHLIYILEFDFHCLKSKIEKALKSFFGDDLIRKKGQYLRSATFSFKD
ncbi:MAG: hypothetical protein N2504_04695 [candidate division WOR-3 bacterium]|nr:hypothetical protein [candidate division WOR-3 bacterium]MCX7947867.1 hypothetical protein [candidate division WOR-3 bacterium]MDW8150689.1 hypothetical protein [candidate division WOR-3 bacterium]